MGLKRLCTFFCGKGRFHSLGAHWVDFASVPTEKGLPRALPVDLFRTPRWQLLWNFVSQEAFAQLGSFQLPMNALRHHGPRKNGFEQAVAGGGGALPAENIGPFFCCKLLEVWTMVRATGFFDGLETLAPLTGRYIGSILVPKRVSKGRSLPGCPVYLVLKEPSWRVTELPS